MTHRRTTYRGMLSRMLLFGMVLSIVGAAATPVRPVVNPGRAQAPMLLKTDASRQLLRQARAALIDFRLDEAERQFGALAERADGGPAGTFHLATVSMYKGMVTDDPAYFDEFFERYDRFEAAVEGVHEGKWKAYLRSEAQLQRAIVAAKAEHYMRAAFSARSAYNGFEELLEAHPRFADAHLGMGLLRLTVASLPGGWRRLLSVLGFDGTAEEALGALRFVEEEGVYQAEVATLLLSVIDVVLYQDAEAGVARLGPFAARHDRSLLGQHLYGFALLADRQAAEAAGVLQAAVSRAEEPDYFFINYIEFYLAEALLRMNQHADAERYYRRYLARHRGPALKSTAHYMLGVAVELQGERDEALQYYRMVKENRDFDSDAAAYRAAQQRLNEPLEGHAFVLLMARNAFDAGRDEEAEQLLDPLMSQTQLPAPVLGEAAYRLGRVYHEQGRLEAAAESYAYAAERPGDPRAKWGPWSRFYLGEIHAAQGRSPQARQAFEEALAYERPFDYEQALEQAVRLAREALDRNE